METRTPTRTYLVVAATLMSGAAIIGATTIPRTHWVSALGFLGAMVGAAATVGQRDGNRWTPRTRWALIAAGVLFAGAMGLLARMVLHGLLLRGG